MARGAPAEAPLLQLQRLAGNRSVLAMLARAPAAPAKAGAAVRRIVLDANVFDQIARGNIEAANTLRALVQKHQVYVSWQAFHEWAIVTKDRKQANTVIRIIEKLQIKSAPPAPSVVLNELKAKNTFTKGKGTASVLARETDLKVAAEAKALDAEVWSFDRGFRNNSGGVEKTLGVKVAPETKTIQKVAANPKASQARALRILGIKEDPVKGHLPEGKVTAPSGGATGGGAAVKETESVAVKEAESVAVKEAESVAVKEAESVAVKEVEKVAVKEAEHVATKGGRLYARVAAKIGIELLDGLIPDPLDALELMVDFARAFAEAREAIRRRSLESGFAIGWAAYLVIPRWEWAKWFAYTTVSRDVATEILGAAGVAENAFNEGLVRGFIYGEKHTTAQCDRLRQKAFNAVLKATGHTPGRYDGDDVYTFGRDDVYLFAGAMRAAAVEVLKEADRRRAARLEQERLAKHAKEVEKRFGTGASWPR
jgi:hypothetical protein